MGGSPKASKVPEPVDPAIAAEEARKKAMAISLAEQRRSAKYGSGSTVVSQGAPGQESRRPDEMIELKDLSSLAANKKGSVVASLKKKLKGIDQVIADPNPQFDPEGASTVPTYVKNKAYTDVEDRIKKTKDSISDADKAELAEAKKDNRIAGFINRNKTRLGVKKTKKG